jgi:hypothetical protein
VSLGEKPSNLLEWSQYFVTNPLLFCAREGGRGVSGLDGRGPWLLVIVEKGARSVVGSMVGLVWHQRQAGS